MTLLKHLKPLCLFEHHVLFEIQFDFGRSGLFVQTMELSVKEIVAKNITFAIPLGSKNTHFTFNAESFYFRFSYFMLNELHILYVT